MTLPPGTILQHLFLKERLRQTPPGTFIEVGVGEGHLSRLLLSAGWQGTGYDLNDTAVSVARDNNREALAEGRYQLKIEDWLESSPHKGVDLILSCMVLEHLNEEEEKRYFEQCQRFLNPGGKIILFVPGAPELWGIEDEIAGHYRRYTREHLNRQISGSGLECQLVQGLTYPLSNWLLPVSNWLVQRKEGQKTSLDMKERTRQSGHRQVAFKTCFPSIFSLMLNEGCLYPFHVLQKVCADHSSALVLYAEGRKV